MNLYQWENKLCTRSENGYSEPSTTPNSSMTMEVMPGCKKTRLGIQPYKVYYGQKQSTSVDLKECSTSTASLATMDSTDKPWYYTDTTTCSKWKTTEMNLSMEIYKNTCPGIDFTSGDPTITFPIVRYWEIELKGVNDFAKRAK